MDKVVPDVRRPAGVSHATPHATPGQPVPGVILEEPSYPQNGGVRRMQMSSSVARTIKGEMTATTTTVMIASSRTARLAPT